MVWAVKEIMNKHRAMREEARVKVSRDVEGRPTGEEQEVKGPLGAPNTFL